MKLFNLHGLLHNCKINNETMKTHIISITFLILGLTASYSQVVTINNINKITNPENRKIVAYFNKGFLPKDFETEKNKFLDAYSKTVGYTVLEISKKELRGFRKTNSTSYYIIQVERVCEQWKSRCHASNKRRKHAYFSFILKLSEKNKEIAYVNTKDAQLSGFEILASIQTINYLAKAINEGMTKKNMYSIMNKDKQELNEKTLWLPESFSNISGIERAGIYPEKIERKPVEEIEKSISNKEIGVAYAFVCHERSSVGKYYKTVIMDCCSGCPLLIYNWCNN